MQLIDIATAPRTTLLAELEMLSTNELRGIVANHEADRKVVLTVAPSDLLRGDVHVPPGLPNVRIEQLVASGWTRESAELEVARIYGRAEPMKGTPGPAHLNGKGHAHDANGAPLEPVVHRDTKPQKRRRLHSSTTAFEAKVLDAIHNGARSRGEIQSATGASRSQAATSLRSLRRRRSVFMAGTRRFARYALSASDALRAHEKAVAGENGPKRPGVKRTKSKGPGVKKARSKSKGGRASSRASTP